jgi:Zn-dependent peptidase ImmA (M78 family)/DNA-binding XRE family transcriptional regulator
MPLFLEKSECRRTGARLPAAYGETGWTSLDPWSSGLTKPFVVLGFVNMASSSADVFPRRLRQARAMRGLSLRALSAAIGGAVSHAALAKYEEGRMAPGSETLIALGAALALPVDFFFRPFRVAVKDVRFRRKAKLGAARQRAIRELAADYVERYREAEELAGDVRAYTPPLAGRPVATVAEAEKAAAMLRKAWSLGEDPLPNVFELMESRGIKVLELPCDDRDFDGLSASTEVGPVVVIAAHLNGNVPRKRMTEVHELGHVVVPTAAGLDGKSEEQLIGAFAGAFLLPATTFTEAFGEKRRRLGEAELVEIKARFGASIMAIMRRARSLGLIEELTYRDFCIKVGRWGWRSRGEPGDDRYAGCESDGRFRQLVRRALAEGAISVSRAAALLGDSVGNVRREMAHMIG